MAKEFNYDPAKFTPLTGYWCLPHGQINDYDRHVLTDLYLPLLGTRAYSIYLLLWEKVPNKELVSERQSHADLMSLLDIDLKTFYNERIKAEALGLIRSYEKHDDIGDYCVYQLFEPLMPHEFFNDDLMSIFLYEQIGEKNYHKLVTKYSQSSDILNDSKEISKDFLEVFQLSNDDLINTPSEVKSAQNEFVDIDKQPQPKIEEPDNSQLDWELISDRIGQSFKISNDDLLKNQELIISLHAFYGINEIAIINVIGQTADIVNNKIDPVRLKKTVQDRFEKNANISVKNSNPQSNTSDNSQQNNVVTHFNRADDLLLQQAKNLAPADFLAAEKNKSGGFTGTVESRALRDMAMKTYLSPSVLNIMVDYILQNSPTLTLPLMETMANDWQQNNVNTPEQALQRLHDFKTKPRNPKRRYNNNKGSRRVEQGTDWSKVTSQPVSGDAQKKQQELQERLRKMRNKDN
ncbi:DnaD domain protein [Companilactobacillus jidongensis]|uniref:DnaD domain protein n=1 Tax=Companilactobacillus jidongensis TaxID=2486006 RepID=UPI000F7A0E58|nr:DnaD domain protein [Companilactobacillus jidongensis]